MRVNTPREILVSNRGGIDPANAHLERDGERDLDFANFLQPLEYVSSHDNGYDLLADERPGDDTGFQKVEVPTTDPDFKTDVRRGYMAGS